MTRSRRPGPALRDPCSRRQRWPDRRHAGLAAALLVALSACSVGEGQRGTAGDDQASVETVRVGRYAFAAGVLYRAADHVLQPLAALPGSGPAADTLAGCVPSIPDLRASRFSRLTPAPDPLWTAWETTDAGGCVGVAGPAEPYVRTLGRWSGAVPDTVLWAPVSRYLAILLALPGRRHSLRVFDARSGLPVEMPWEQECETSGECDVSGAAWLGGTLLNVDIRLGPAELPVPFEVNVASAAQGGQTEEI